MEKIRPHQRIIDSYPYEPIDRLTIHPLNTEIYGSPENHTGDELTEYNELKEQMKESGWVRPITINQFWQILDGVRRYSAAKELGWTKIPVEVRIDLDLKTDTDTLELIILSNAYRKKPQSIISNPK